MYKLIHNKLIIKHYNNTPLNNSTAQAQSCHYNNSTSPRIRITIISTLIAMMAYQAAWCNHGFPICDNPREVIITVLLQGYYLAEHDKMQRVQDMNNGTVTDRYGAPVSDRILVELRHKDNYSTLVASGWTDLLEDGTAAFELITDLQDEYYTVIKTRNHLKTVSAQPVCFSGTDRVSYDFTTSPSRAIGDNQVFLGNGRYGLYSGDVNQDGAVDINDLSATIDQVRKGATGYIPEDINGDGFTDINDLSTVIDNVRKGIVIMAPP
jgi:hypothetical protein